MSLTPLRTDPPTGPFVRRAARSDGPALLRMIGDLSGHHGGEAITSLARIEADLFGPEPWALAFVVERDGAPLGYALLVRHYRAHVAQRGIDLHHVFVAEPARGTGLGRCLVRAALDEARRLGCAYLTVGTDPDNVRAQRFYEALGFVRAAPNPRFRRKVEVSEGEAQPF